jgi:hypothetical protein
LRRPTPFEKSSAKGPVLGRVCKSEPEHNGGQANHGIVIGSPLFIAGRHAPTLCEAVDHTLDSTPQAVEGSIERAAAALIHFARNGGPNPMPAQILPDHPAAIAFIADEAARAPFGSTRPRPFDRAWRHQRREHRRFMALARRQEPRQGLALAFGAAMDLGAEAALPTA